MSTFDIAAAADIPPARLHAAFGVAFEDYLIGPFRLPLADWPAFLGRQGVDLGLSRVAVVRGEPLAFCLAAPRPECGTWRLGTMGAVPAARGSGVARALLEDFVARAQSGGAIGVELECFARNARAVRLYERHGFRTVDALYGYQCAGGPVAAPAAAPLEIGLEEAFTWLDGCGDAGCPLPLQVTPRSLRALPAGLQAWRHGTAQLVWSQAGGARLQVHSLVDRQPAQDDAAVLVGALLARHPLASIHVPQLQRTAVGGAALERLGFERLPLHQLWMRRPS